MEFIIQEIGMRNAIELAIVIAASIFYLFLVFKIENSKENLKLPEYVFRIVECYLNIFYLSSIVIISKESVAWNWVIIGSVGTALIALIDLPKKIDKMKYSVLRDTLMLGFFGKKFINPDSYYRYAFTFYLIAIVQFLTGAIGARFGSIIGIFIINFFVICIIGYFCYIFLLCSNGKTK